MQWISNNIRSYPLIKWLPVLHTIITLNDITDTLISPQKSVVISYVCGIKTEGQQHSQTELA